MIETDNCDKCRNTGWICVKDNSNGLTSCDCKFSRMGYIGGMG